MFNIIPDFHDIMLKILFPCHNFQSTVQLGLDFLFPESVGEAVRLAEEIRCLPNDHEAKLQVLEVRQRKLFQEVFSPLLSLKLLCSL